MNRTEAEALAKARSSKKQGGPMSNRAKPWHGGKQGVNCGPELVDLMLSAKRRKNEIRRFTVDDWYRRLAENAKLDAEVRTPPLGTYEEERERERQSAASGVTGSGVNGKASGRLARGPAPASHDRGEVSAQRR